MSRHDGDISAAGEAILPLDELIGALGRSRLLGIDRTDALARFLSGGEGWSDARAALGGTFAKSVARPVRLMGREE